MPDALHSLAELLGASNGDPLVRRTLGSQLLAAWQHGTALFWVTVEEDRRWASALGSPADVAALLDGGLPDELAAVLPMRCSLPRGTVLPAGLVLREARDWDFRWTDAPPPPQPLEERVRGVDTHDPALAALIAVANPTAWARPGNPGVRRWVALVGTEGGLNACAADTSGPVGHISSIGTRPECRGRGLGAAVTARLTRDLLAEFGLVTLGMYAENDTGRHLYDRLGFHDEHRRTGGWLEQSASEPSGPTAGYRRAG